MRHSIEEAAEIGQGLVFLGVDGDEDDVAGESDH